MTDFALRANCLDELIDLFSLFGFALAKVEGACFCLTKDGFHKLAAAEDAAVEGLALVA